MGVASSAIEATELIVTDAFHGGADPQADPLGKFSGATWARLLNRPGAIVTGFIGATPTACFTTPGPGRFRLFPPPFLVPALDADEISSGPTWKACSPPIPAGQRSPHHPGNFLPEAAELAYFGAKVLHPRLCAPVLPAAIPVWIATVLLRKSWHKINRAGAALAEESRRSPPIRDVALISVGGRERRRGPTWLAAPFPPLRNSAPKCCSFRNHLRKTISASSSPRPTRRKRSKPFAANSRKTSLTRSSTTSPWTPTSPFVAVVGENMRGTPGVAGRTFHCLGQEGVTSSPSPSSSETNISFVVSDGVVKPALLATHRDLALAGAEQPPERFRGSSIESSEVT